ncbi:MAG TPA: hypothetical protein VFU21_18485 [Kofleriaceae bacterium]|nr:hypothetical protein [Kofleriaceae bacterium]
MSILRAAFLLLFPLVVAACCRGGGGGDDEGGRGVATRVSASDLYRDYSKLRGVELLEAYAGGVEVTGTVSQAIELGEEGLQISLSVARGGVVLAFADLGAAARQKGVRPGVELRARCQVGGKPQDTLFLTACTLQ